MLNVVSWVPTYAHGQDSRPVELPLEGDIVVLGCVGLVVVVVAGHVKRHEISELEVRERSRARWKHKGEVLSLRDSIGAGDVGTCELRRLWRSPVEAPGSIAENTEVTVICDAQVVDTESRTNAGFCPPRPTGRPKARRRYQYEAQSCATGSERLYSGLPDQPGTRLPGGELGNLTDCASRNWCRQTAIDVAPRPGYVQRRPKLRV